MKTASDEQQAPLRRALVFQRDVLAGHVAQVESGEWSFIYEPGYTGPPVSLSLPVRVEPYFFLAFPPFLDGLLPEGAQLEALLRQLKIDRRDCYRQLIAVGQDVVGSLKVVEEGGR
jgi:serine/threonine-protein kinase HipA